MTKFIVNNRTDPLKTDINLFFTITNCPLSFVEASHKLQIHVFVCLLTIKISQWVRENFYSYRKTMFCNQSFFRESPLIRTEVWFNLFAFVPFSSSLRYTISFNIQRFLRHVASVFQIIFGLLSLWSASAIREGSFYFLSRHMQYTIQSFHF